LVQEVNVVTKSDKKHSAHFREIEQELKEPITNISHDLRTPLASILSYFELVNDETATGAEKEQYLMIIEKRAKSLRNLLDNCYDLVRIEIEEECQLITIDNTGNSLMEKELVYLFESFWHGSNIKKASGSGLGLYICRLLMRQMGGDIFAQINSNEFSPQSYY